MSSNIREQYVSQFNTAMGQAVDVPYNMHLLNLRMRLIKEEVAELEEEVAKAKYQSGEYTNVLPDTKEAILKELCDLMYVVSGFAVTFGLPVQPAFVRVHKSNMSKLVDGKPVLDEGGKVMKGPNYQKPDLSDLV